MELQGIAAVTVAQCGKPTGRAFGEDDSAQRRHGHAVAVRVLRGKRRRTVPEVGVCLPGFCQCHLVRPGFFLRVVVGDSTTEDFRDELVPETDTQSGHLALDEIFDEPAHAIEHFSRPSARRIVFVLAAMEEEITRAADQDPIVPANDIGRVIPALFDVERRYKSELGFPLRGALICGTLGGLSLGSLTRLDGEYEFHPDRILKKMTPRQAS